MELSSSFRPSTPASIEVVATAPCGAAVLCLGLLRRMDLRGIVDRALPTQSPVSHGEVVEALVLDHLTSARPLDRVAQWAHELGLAALTRRDPERLNDDRLGRTLDALAERTDDLQAAITARLVDAFDVAVTDAPYTRRERPRGVEAKTGWLPVETRQRRGATRIAALGDGSDSRTQPTTTVRSLLADLDGDDRRRVVGATRLRPRGGRGGRGGALELLLPPAQALREQSLAAREGREVHAQVLALVEQRAGVALGERALGTVTSERWGRWGSRHRVPPRRILRMTSVAVSPSFAGGLRISYVTPDARHQQLDAAQLEQRRALYELARERHPKR